jgi:hypothetical protein
MIRLSLHPSPASETSAFNNIQQLTRWALALAKQRFELFAFRTTQPHNIPLYRYLLRSHHRLRCHKWPQKRITQSFQID